MSSIPQRPQDNDSDAWETLADNRDVLETIIEEDMPFAPYAENLLDALDERGYE